MPQVPFHPAAARPWPAAEFSIAASGRFSRFAIRHARGSWRADSHRRAARSEQAPTRHRNSMTDRGSLAERRRSVANQSSSRGRGCRAVFRAGRRVGESLTADRCASGKPARDGDARDPRRWNTRCTAMAGRKGAAIRRGPGGDRPRRCGPRGAADHEPGPRGARHPTWRPRHPRKPKTVLARTATRTWRPTGRSALHSMPPVSRTLRADELAQGEVRKATARRASGLPARGGGTARFRVGEATRSLMG